MPAFSALDISGSALAAERFRMELIAQNLANIHTTRTPEGGPYRRKEPIFAAVEPVAFRQYLDKGAQRGVGVAGVVVDQSPPKLVYNPSHPDAGPDGYVRMPNINPVTEMVNMIAASRAYEANVAAITHYRRMVERAMAIAEA
ncbi:MAG: flagellar basal-body rod protein FlgC [Candidatus Poribacteria bacterium]|nr:MAG: flagellar basal-body rod protein FlgC [Candidatus Poribacteria bacterium]